MVFTQYHVQYAGQSTWVDITERVISQVQFSEGRSVTRLGGPLPPAVPSTLQCFLDNHDGFFTKGAGSDFGVGSKFRLQWRAATGDPWITRYIGSISEFRTLAQDGVSVIRTRWYGALVYLTGSNLPERNYGQRTPQLLMGAICDAAGVPSDAREFDTDTEAHSITASPGYEGVIEFADLVQGFIYDTPDGKVRLELPATRRGKSIVARYTDAAGGAAEIEIPPPEVATNPFGILNEVTGELRVFTPTIGSTGIDIIPAVQSDLHVEWPDWTEHTFVTPLPFEPTDGLMVTEWNFGFILTYPPQSSNNIFVDTILEDPDTEDELERDTAGRVRLRAEIRNLAFSIAGNAVETTFEMRGWYEISADTPFPIPTAYNSDGEVETWSLRNIQYRITDLFATLQAMEVHTRTERNVASQALYGGVRRRERPLVITEFTSDLSAYTPDLSELEDRIHEEINLYASARPAYIVSLDTGTPDRTADLMARRISDKIQLRLAGASQYNFTDDFFIEALDTSIDPAGNVRQRLWLVEVPPVIRPNAPDNLAATKSGTSVVLTWELPTAGDPPTGYRIYRGTTSGDLTLIHSTTTTDLTYTDTVPVDDDVYYYQVAGYNAGGDGELSDEISTTPRIVINLPAAWYTAQGVWLAPNNERPLIPTTLSGANTRYFQRVAVESTRIVLHLGATQTDAWSAVSGQDLTPEWETDGRLIITAGGMTITEDTASQDFTEIYVFGIDSLEGTNFVQNLSTTVGSESGTLTLEIPP